MENRDIKVQVENLKKILFESCSEDDYMDLMLELDLYVNEAKLALESV